MTLAWLVAAATGTTRQWSCCTTSTLTNTCFTRTSQRGACIIRRSCASFASTTVGRLSGSRYFGTLALYRPVQMWVLVENNVFSLYTEHQDVLNAEGGKSSSDVRCTGLLGYEGVLMKLMVMDRGELTSILNFRKRQGPINGDYRVPTSMSGRPSALGSMPHSNSFLS